jgi:hypothetical protein
VVEGFFVQEGGARHSLGEVVFDGLDHDNFAWLTHNRDLSHQRL